MKQDPLPHKTVPAERFRKLSIKPTPLKQTLYRLVDFGTSLKGLLVTAIVLLVLILLSIYNPLVIIQDLRNQQLISQILSVAANTYSEKPVIANIVDIDTLTKDNSVTAAIYEDAMNGDVVLIFANSLIIYRPDSQQIIYEGDNPTAAFQKNQQQLITNIQDLAKSSGLVTAGSTEVPQLSLVTDPDQVRVQNPTAADFYSGLALDDIIAFFVLDGKIAIYRSASGEFIATGNYQLAIQNF
jgi:hypothetical protein